MKPHKGKIKNWKTIDFSEQFPEQAHDNLGYRIWGEPVGHPTFDRWILTSAVVKYDHPEIETINSRYTLGERADGQP